jgi:hypothetical protein
MIGPAMWNGTSPIGTLRAGNFNHTSLGQERIIHARRFPSRDDSPHPHDVTDERAPLSLLRVCALGVGTAGL